VARKCAKCMRGRAVVMVQLAEGDPPIYLCRKCAETVGEDAPQADAPA